MVTRASILSSSEPPVSASKVSGLAAPMAGAYKPAVGEQGATLICGANTDPGSVV